MKTCSSCRRNLDESLFNFRNKSKGILQYHCKDCTRKEGQGQYSKSRTTIIAAAIRRNKGYNKRRQNFKDQFVCCLCQESFKHCLEFHHLDPATKSFDLGNSHNLGPKKFLQELAKCVCVCANCHRKIHWGVLDTSQLLPIDPSKVIL